MLECELFLQTHFRW